MLKSLEICLKHPFASQELEATLKLFNTAIYYLNSLFGSPVFRFGFGFEGVQIQILCLGKLKEMDLNLVPNPTKIQ